jgi:competence protein ComEC
MSWKTTPFFRLLPPLSIGIFLSEYIGFDAFPVNICVLLSAITIIISAAFQYKHRNMWQFGAMLQIFLLIFGYCATIKHNELRDDAHFSKKDQITWFSGICSEAITKGVRYKIPIKIEAVGTNEDSIISASGNLICFLDSTYASLKYGDKVLIKCKPFKVKGANNPNAFDYGRYLHFQNIHYQAFIKKDSLKVLSQDNGLLFWKIAYEYRDKILIGLQRYFPNEEEYSVAAALLVGFKDDLSDEIKTAYTQTGSMHALVVSGTHVGVIFAGLLWLIRLFHMPIKIARIWEPLLFLCTIWGFTLITGATASVVRAALMFSLVLLGKACFRNASVWNLIAGAAFLQLFFNPYLLFDAGFQLSYSAVVGMIFFYPKFIKKSPKFKSKWKEYAWSNLLVGITAQLGTLPLALFYFHQFPTYFWLSGWVVILGGSIFLYSCFFLGLFALTIPILADFLGMLMSKMVWAMNQLIYLIQKLPFGMIEGIWVASWAVLLLYLFIVLINLAFTWRRPYYLLAGLSVFAFLMFCRMIHQLNAYENEKMVIYSMNKNSLIDFFDGKTVFSMSDPIPEKNVKFAAQNNRWACYATLGEQVNLQKDTILKTNHLYWKAPLLQFYNKRFLIIDDAKWLKSDISSTFLVDTVILRNNPMVNILGCKEKFGSSFFIFDGSNKQYRVQKWITECEANHISFHDTREQGYFEVKIKDNK